MEYETSPNHSPSFDRYWDKGENTNTPTIAAPKKGKRNLWWVNSKAPALMKVPAYGNASMGSSSQVFASRRRKVGKR